MIEAKSFANKDVAVFGLGLSGLATAHALMAGGARVTAWDDNADARASAMSENVPLLEPGTDGWGKASSLVLSPGVPLHHPAPHPVVALAHAAGSEIIGDIEILGREQGQASFIGITGTNGKSTTTALLGHILESAGRKVQVGGNLGTPALSFDPLEDDGIYVLEVSSYQLELTTSLVFDVAVFLNVSVDHLDRHGDMAGYIAAKHRIFNGQGASQAAIIGVDDPHTQAVFRDLANGSAATVIPVSAVGPVAGGVYVEEGILYDDSARASAPMRVMDLRPIATLPGAHNWQNAAAAYAAARAAGLAPETIVAAMATYPGLAHRQQIVGAWGGITYVNDSKATNADAAARALACYDDIYWIAGGRAKEGGLSALMPYLGRVRHAFLIGEAEDAFADELSGQTQVHRSKTLQAAVCAARETAQAEGAENPVVLLSPAAASFDQFRNFAHRGDAFCAIVREQEGAA